MGKYTVTIGAADAYRYDHPNPRRTDVTYLFVDLEMIESVPDKQRFRRIIDGKDTGKGVKVVHAKPGQVIDVDDEAAAVMVRAGALKPVKETEPAKSAKPAEPKTPGDKKK